MKTTTISVGDVKITPFLDTALLGDPKAFMPDVAEQFIAECAPTLDERGLFTLSITCYLVESEDKRYLIDTGLGNRRRAGFPMGHLDETLQSAGLKLEDIDTVIHTHLHIDHVGWNTVEDDAGKPKLFFPNANFLIQQAEWDFWMTPEHLADPQYECLVQCVQPLTGLADIKFFDGETAIDKNLTFVATPGHTPGHVSVGVYSQGERAILVGDASHHPIQLLHPDWSPIFDVDPIQSAATREKLFDDVIDDERLWMAGHWPFPGVGRLVRLDGKRVFQAS